MTETDELAARLDAHLGETDADLRVRYPGDDGSRQPVHTVYVPANRYHAGLVPEWSRQACAALHDVAPDAAALGDLLGIDGTLATEVLPLVRAKLEAEPVEDLRIDFEDGLGDLVGSEDDVVTAAAGELLTAAERNQGTPFSGIRFKCFEESTRRRGLDTLAQFVARVARDGRLPQGFVVTLPKVTAVAQVEAMVMACTQLERDLGLHQGALRFEIQVETPQAILLADGTAGVARMIAAASGRCTGLHYGTYDYSASLGIGAQYQGMEHPVADHAKAVMQVAAAGTGVRLSDGSTNVLPVGSSQARSAASRLHARLVRRSLERGYYQGWDLHPAQLPTRYAATFAFYRSGFAQAAARLSAYVSQDASGFLDEPATARALAWFIARGLDCGAIRDAEVAERVGLDAQAVRRLAHPRANTPPAG